MKRHLREAIDYARARGAAGVAIDYTGSGHAKLIIEAPDGRRGVVIVSSSPSCCGARQRWQRDISAALAGGGAQ